MKSHLRVEVLEARNLLATSVLTASTADETTALIQTTQAEVQQISGAHGEDTITKIPTVSLHGDWPFIVVDYRDMPENMEISIFMSDGSLGDALPLTTGSGQLRLNAFTSSYSRGATIHLANRTDRLPVGEGIHFSASVTARQFIEEPTGTISVTELAYEAPSAPEPQGLAWIRRQQRWLAEGKIEGELLTPAFSIDASAGRTTITLQHENMPQGLRWQMVRQDGDSLQPLWLEEITEGSGSSTFYLVPFPSDYTGILRLVDADTGEVVTATEPFTFGRSMKSSASLALTSLPSLAYVEGTPAVTEDAQEATSAATTAQTDEGAGTPAQPINSQDLDQHFTQQVNGSAAVEMVTRTPTFSARDEWPWLRIDYTDMPEGIEVVMFKADGSDAGGTPLPSGTGHVRVNAYYGGFLNGATIYLARRSDHQPVGQPIRFTASYLQNRFTEAPSGTVTVSELAHETPAVPPVGGIALLQDREVLRGLGIETPTATYAFEAGAGASTVGLRYENMPRGFQFHLDLPDLGDGATFSAMDIEPGSGRLTFPTPILRNDTAGILRIVDATTGEVVAQSSRFLFNRYVVTSIADESQKELIGVPVSYQMVAFQNDEVAHQFADGALDIASLRVTESNRDLAAMLRPDLFGATAGEDRAVLERLALQRNDGQTYNIGWAYRSVEAERLNLIHDVENAGVEAWKLLCDAVQVAFDNALRQKMGLADSSAAILPSSPTLDMARHYIRTLPDEGAIRAAVEAHFEELYGFWLHMSGEDASLSTHIQYRNSYFDDPNRPVEYASLEDIRAAQLRALAAGAISKEQYSQMTAMLSQGFGGTEAEGVEIPPGGSISPVGDLDALALPSNPARATAFLDNIGERVAALPGQVDVVIDGVSGTTSLQEQYSFGSSLLEYLASHRVDLSVNHTSEIERTIADNEGVTSLDQRMSSDDGSTALDNLGVIVEIADSTNQAVRVIAASEAFRKYSWLAGEPMRNLSGNLRGMVIDGNARVVYRVTGQLGEGLTAAGNTLMVIDLAKELSRSWQDIERVVNSGDDLGTKSAKLVAQLGGILTRVIWQTAVTHVTAASSLMRYTAWINPGYWVDRAGYWESLNTMNTLIENSTIMLQSSTSGDSFWWMLQVNIHGR